MFNLKSMALSALLIGSSAQADDVQNLLKRADAWRLAAETARVVTQVQLYEDDVLTREREYHVYVSPGRKSLVLFQHAAERGQKVLMLEDKFWMFMPKSRRPIRITPMQKLLGEASTGDVSTLTWAEQYTGELVDEQAEFEGQAAQQLALTAAVKGASYARIELWLARGDAFPLAAKFYLKSGKLAKEATFARGEGAAADRVVAMVLFDRIQPGKRTDIRYVGVEPVEIAGKYYNPAFLARNPKID